MADFLFRVRRDSALQPDAYHEVVQGVVRGGRVGQHTEHLSYLLAEMQVLHRAHPGAQW